MNSSDWPNNKIDSIMATAADVKNKRDKAWRYFDFAKRQLSGQGDEDIIYNNVYDAVRLACEAILLLNGGRVKSSTPGHHFLAISEAGRLAGNGLEREFQRFQKMRQKRNMLQYGDLTSVSESELTQMMVDSLRLLQRLDGLLASSGASEHLTSK